MSDWMRRGYEPERSEPGWDDEGALGYLLGVSYARSRAGQRAGASHAGRRTSEPDPQAVARQKAFLEAHRPVWAWLLAHADVELLVDPEKPWILWAWLITSGGDVVHAVGCKRTLVEAGIAADAVRDLLGERLGRHQVSSLELPQLRTRGPDAIGIDRPQTWSLDPTYLLTRMGERRAA